MACSVSDFRSVRQLDRIQFMLAEDICAHVHLFTPNMSATLGLLLSADPICCP